MNHAAVLQLLSFFIPVLFWAFVTEDRGQECKSELEVLILGIYKCQKKLLKHVDVGFGLPQLQKNYTIYHDVDPSVQGMRAGRFPYLLEREHMRFDQDEDEKIVTLDDSSFYQVLLVLLKVAGDRMSYFGKDLKLFMSFLICRQA